MTLKTFKFIHPTHLPIYSSTNKKGQFFNWANTKIRQNLVDTVKYTFDVKKVLKQV